MKNMTNKELQEMLKGLEESLVIFRQVNDMPTVYQIKRDIKRIKHALDNCKE